MPPLYKIRKGWENENLARFILSKFCFVAQPSTISDDVGVDFFCTIFEIEKIGKEKYLFPKNSFVIQIKSNQNQIEITNKLKYLEQLEIPFLVGVVDKKQEKISIYSGEYLDAFFAKRGSGHQENEKIFINLFEGNLVFKDSLIEKPKRFIIKFPKLFDIKVNFDYNNEKKQVKELIEICSNIQENISSRKNHQFFFKFKDGTQILFAGPTSMIYHQENFLKRFIESVQNLKLEYQIDKSESKFKEINKYREFYENIKKDLINSKQENYGYTGFLDKLFSDI